MRGAPDAVGAASGAAACECGHRARGRDLSDAHVVKVCHVHITKHINGDSERAEESGRRAQAVKKRVIAPAASKGAYRAERSYAAHAVAQMLSHEHAQRNRVDRHAKRLIEHRRRALPVRPPRIPAARQRAHVPVAGRLRGQPGHGARGGGGARGASGGRAGMRANGTRGRVERAGGGAHGAVGPRGAGQARCGGVGAGGGGKAARGAGRARRGRNSPQKGAVRAGTAAAAGGAGGRAGGVGPRTRGAGDGVRRGERAEGARGAEEGRTRRTVVGGGAGRAGERSDAMVIRISYKDSPGWMREHATWVAK